VSFGSGYDDQLNPLIEKSRTLKPMTVGPIKWEKLTLLVDSGASDTVVPQSVCSAAAIHWTRKVGVEYEIADGTTLENLGERRCMMKTAENESDDNAFEMDFQVVDVNKPLLSVTKVCEKGHSVIFEKDRGAILIGGDPKRRIELKKVGGTFELDVWLKPSEGFGRPE
jgi:hypothetical protein